jgi:hypothetical protein
MAFAFVLGHEEELTIRNRIGDQRAFEREPAFPSGGEASIEYLRRGCHHSRDLRVVGRSARLGSIRFLSIVSALHQIAMLLDDLLVARAILRMLETHRSSRPRGPCPVLTLGRTRLPRSDTGPDLPMRRIVQSPRLKTFQHLRRVGWRPFVQVKLAPLQSDRLKGLSHRLRDAAFASGERLSLDQAGASWRTERDSNPR